MLLLEFGHSDRWRAVSEALSLPLSMEGIAPPSSMRSEMASGIHHTSQHLTGLGLAMTPPGNKTLDYPRDLKFNQAIDVNHAASGITSNPLQIDQIQDSFPISDTSVGSMFAMHKKTPHVPIFMPSSSPRLASNRTGVVPKGLPLVSGFGPESTSLSSFDLEYALLEQALRKDGGSTTHPDYVSAQIRTDKKSSSGLLETDFFFPDILGENEMAAEAFPSITKEDISMQPATRFNSFTGNMMTRGNHDDKDVSAHGAEAIGMDAELSTGLASIVESDVSGDFQETELSSSQTKEHILSSSSDSSGEGFSSSFQDCEVGPREQFSNHNAQWVLRDLQNPNNNRTGRVQKSWPATGKASTSEGTGSEVKKKSSLRTRQSEMDSLNIVQSPHSDSSMIVPEICSHPDLYPNLSEEIRGKVDRLQDTISSMPRRKLRESLAKGVTIEDVEPLMFVNRDELAGMLKIGVTTWKMFVHRTLGIPRWPARALKSQQVKERKLLHKKLEAEQRGELDVAERVQRELDRVMQTHLRRRKMFRNDAKLRVAKAPIRKKSGGQGEAADRI